MERKKLIEKTVIENEAISISRYIEEKGIAFFELAKQNELEGIVAKEKTSKYYIGKRSKVWQKIKVLKEDDVIICGYVTEAESGNIKDLILGVYDEDHNLCFRGTIYMGLSSKDEKTVLDYAKKHPSKPLFDTVSSRSIVWIKPELVGVVKYMMRTKSGGMRQPIFKGLRDDKKATDCIDHNI
jgi:ATP-dependent DNA ligase